MSVEYVEEFRVAGRTLGIELRDKRYILWVGGCAIGDANTLESARELLLAYIESWLRMSIEGAQEQVTLWRKELHELILHPAGILHFIVAYTAPEKL